MIPGQSGTAGFFTVINHGERNCTLTGARTAIAGRVEIHEHRHQNGMMSMRPVPSLAVPPGQRVVLEPGGYHLMAFELSRRLKAGETEAVELDFGPCGVVQTLFPIRRVK